MTDSPLAPVAAFAQDFAAVPRASTRHDGWTEDRQRRFVALLALTGSVEQAVRGVGKSGASAYRLRKRPDAAGFAAAWDDALDYARDRAFAAAVDRAVDGVTVARFYRGRFNGTAHRYQHDGLLAALKKAEAAK